MDWRRGNTVGMMTRSTAPQTAPSSETRLRLAGTQLEGRRGVTRNHGAVAQLGEHLLCKQEVTGSIPVSSTNLEKGSDPFSAAQRGDNSFRERGMTPFPRSLTIWNDPSIGIRSHRNLDMSHCIFILFFRVHIT